MEEGLHGAGVAGHDDDQVVPVVLHVFQEHLHRLVAEVVGAVRVHQGVGLVDEQHPADGLLDGLLGLQGGLPHKAGHQTGAVHLHQLPLGQHPDGVVEPGQQPGHRSLAGARVAQEHQVQGHGGDRQIRLLPEPAHLHQVDQALHVLFHLIQAAQTVQLGHQFLQGGLGRRLLVLLRRGRRELVPGGGLNGRRVRSGRPGDEGICLQGGAVPLQPVPVAQVQQNIGAGVDKGGLPLAHHPVGGGEQEQHQGQLVGKAPGQAGAVGAVVLAQILKEGGGPEQIEIGHPRGHLPVQGGGNGAARGPDGVVHLHILGGDGAGAVRLPHPQGAPAHGLVHLPAEAHAQGGVGDELAEGGDGLTVLAVYFSGGHGFAHGGQRLPSDKIMAPLYRKGGRRSRERILLT